MKKHIKHEVDDDSSCLKLYNIRVLDFYICQIIYATVSNILTSGITSWFFPKQ